MIYPKVKLLLLKFLKANLTRLSSFEASVFVSKHEIRQ